jgi:hypothetical protein
MTSTCFYRLHADPARVPRWYLGSPIDPLGNELDPRLFTDGTAVAAQPFLTLPIGQYGAPVDFNFRDFDTIVTPIRVNAALEALVDSAIARIPVAVDASVE